MKKKYTPSPKDKKDWIDFVENIGKVDPKEEDLPSINRKKINRKTTQI